MKVFVKALPNTDDSQLTDFHLFFPDMSTFALLFFTFAADNKKERMRNMEKLEDTS